jgi:hypothetical protein
VADTVMPRPRLDTTAPALAGGPVFLDADEAARLAACLGEASALGATLADEARALETWLAAPMWVPGSGPGGGIEHEQHKRHYTQLFAAGRHWQMTGDRRLLDRIRRVLLAYAALYPTLPFAKPYSQNPPGKLFHQILNEHMWLLFAAAGYGAVRAALTVGDRAAIEQNLFEPMVAMFTVTYAHHFDIIHNHGMWASGAVGVAGIACGRADWVRLAVDGQFGDRATAGFLAQLRQLFSPTGYYEEGPYYQRFALQPMFLFAEALERARPDLGIYGHADHAIRRAFDGALACALDDGTLIPLNDALKRMTIGSLGYRLGASLLYRRDGAAPRLVALAERHGRVWPDGAGLMLSDALKAGAPRAFVTGSRLMTCGADGDRGAVGILRVGGAVASLDAGSHGLAEHAHFDGLTLGFFEGGAEALRDYGAVRWINVEPKNGGAYLPENVSFAKQTIAHNTVTVDETSQHGGDADRAVGTHGRMLRFAAETEGRALMAGEVADFTPGVRLRRTTALLTHADFERPLLIDLLDIAADAAHRYDHALYFDGQVIVPPAGFAAADALTPLGTAPGYRHLWRLGSAPLRDGANGLTWLQGATFRTLTLAASAPAELILTRIGANDPAFNLRAEPGLVVRLNARDAWIANVLESHGYFDEATETSRAPHGQIARVERVVSDGVRAVLRLVGHDRDGQPAAWRVGLALDGNTHELKGFAWSGAVEIIRDSAP